MSAAEHEHQGTGHTRHLHTVNRDNTVYEYHHPEHVTALEEIQDEIQSKAAELDELKRERLRRISRAKEDGMQQVRIALHLGVSKQLLRSWTLEAKELRRLTGERELF